MSYEPRGKVAALIEKMRQVVEDKPIWTAGEIAAAMEVPQSALTAHLDAAVRHEAIFRKTEHGKSWFSLQPLQPIVIPGSRSIFERESTASGWRPPAMSTPRALPPAPTRAALPEPRGPRYPELESRTFTASTPAATPVPSPAPAPRPQAAAPVATHAQAPAPEPLRPPPSAAPAPAPTPMPTEPPSAAPVTTVQPLQLRGEKAFETWYHPDGRVRIWGTVLLTDGSIVLSATQVEQIKRGMAGSRACAA